MANEISAGVGVDIEANGDTFGRCLTIDIGVLRVATSNREASCHRSRRIVEVGSDRECLCLLSRCEGAFNKQTFGVGLKR